MSTIRIRRREEGDHVDCPSPRDPAREDFVGRVLARFDEVPGELQEMRHGHRVSIYEGLSGGIALLPHQRERVLRRPITHPLGEKGDK